MYVFVNINFIFSLALGLSLFFISTNTTKLLNTPHRRAVLMGGSLFLALISFIIPITYVIGTIGENPTYAEFRAYPYTELLVVLFAPCAGVINGLITNKKANPVLTSLCLMVMVLYVSSPFIKPLIRPLQKNLQNKWQDNVAIQSTGSTCGPSSLATILNYYGKQDTEANIAQHAYTSSSSTENWYLARYAHSQGFDYQFLTVAKLDQVPTPSIIGVRLGYIGYFIVLLGTKNGLYEIADSLSGRAFLTERQFNQKYRYTGFALHITHN